MLNVVGLGAIGNGSQAAGSINTAAFNAAWAVAHASGGDEIYVPKGHYFLDRQSPLDSYGIRAVGLSKIRFVGDAPCLTRLSLVDAANAHLVCLEDVSDITIEGMTLDGNGPNQANGVHCLRVLGADGLVVDGLLIQWAAHYGAGFQDGINKRIRLRNTDFEDCGGDSVDFKNKLSANEDIEVSSCTSRRHGRKANASPQAAFDIRGPVRMSQIEALEIGYGPSGLCGARFRDGEATDVNGIGGHKSMMSVFRAKACTKTGTVGIEAAARQVQMSAGYIEGAGHGAIVQQHENALSSVAAVSCGTGFLLNKPGTLTTNADRTSMAACLARGCSDFGFDIETDSNQMEAMISRSNAAAVRCAGNNNRWSGTRGTDPVINTGSGNSIT